MQQNVFDDKIMSQDQNETKNDTTKTEGINEIQKKLGRGRRQGKL